MEQFAVVPEVDQKAIFLEVQLEFKKAELLRRFSCEGLCSKCRLYPAINVYDSRSRAITIFCRTVEELETTVSVADAEGALHSLCYDCAQRKPVVHVNQISMKTLKNMLWVDDYKRTTKTCQFEKCSRPGATCVEGKEYLFDIVHLHSKRCRCAVCSAEPSLRKKASIQEMVSSTTKWTTQDLRAVLNPRTVSMMHSDCLLKMLAGRRQSWATKAEIDKARHEAEPRRLALEFLLEVHARTPVAAAADVEMPPLETASGIPVEPAPYFTEEEWDAVIEHEPVLPSISEEEKRKLRNEKRRAKRKQKKDAEREVSAAVESDEDEKKERKRLQRNEEQRKKRKQLKDEREEALRCNEDALRRKANEKDEMYARIAKMHKDCLERLNPPRPAAEVSPYLIYTHVECDEVIEHEPSDSRKKQRFDPLPPPRVKPRFSDDPDE